MDAFNAELLRVDAIVTQFEEVSDRVESTSTTVQDVANAPVEIVTDVADRVRRAWRTRKSAHPEGYGLRPTRPTKRAAEPRSPMRSTSTYRTPEEASHPLMANDRITLTVPARSEYAQHRAHDRRALVGRTGMTYDDVDDVRMAAEEAFVYAVDTLPEGADVTFDVHARRRRARDRGRASAPSRTSTDEEAERARGVRDVHPRVRLRRVRAHERRDGRAVAPTRSSARGASMPTSRRPREAVAQALLGQGATRASCSARYRLEGDEAARDELITMYLNLVKYLASRFRNRGEPIDDLIQVGTIGLIKAIDRFDIERAGRVHHLRDADHRRRAEALLPRQGLGHQGPAAPAGAVVPGEPGGRRAHAEAAALADASPRSPSTSRSRPRRCSRRWRRARRTTSSRWRATAAATASDSFSILEYIGKDDALMAVVDDRTTLSAAFKQLTPQEQRVLYLRFFEGLTQTEIARQLDISQMQVSRLLRRTLQDPAREHREGVSDSRDDAGGPADALATDRATRCGPSSAS